MCLTVKKVALRLGVSTSTVYRMREHSPFPFIKDRRFVLIEKDGFEAYLLARRSGTAGPELDTTETTELQQSAEPIAGARSQLGEDSQLTVPTLLPDTPQQASTMNGQRDLLSGYWPSF
jgi:excisionase family DNA binding protein